MRNDLRARADLPNDFLTYLRALDDPDPWLPKWIPAAGKLLGADAAFLSVREQGVFRLRGALGLTRAEEALAAKALPVPLAGQGEPPTPVIENVPSLVLALASEDRILGLLTLLFRKGEPPRDSSMVEAVRLTAAQTLAHWLGCRREETGTGGVFSKLAEDLQNAETSHQIHQAAARAASLALAADAALAMVPDTPGNSLIPAASVGIPQLPDVWSVALQNERNVAVRALSSGGAPISGTVDSENWPRAFEEGFRSALSARATGYRSQGVLVALFREPHPEDTDAPHLLRALSSLLAVAWDRLQLSEVRRRQAEQVARMNQAAEEGRRALLDAYDATLAVLGRTLELRQSEAGGHMERVVGLAMALGEKLGLPEERLRLLKWGALLHDIGKIGVTDALLEKVAPFGSEERALMVAHPRLGFSLVQRLGFLGEARDVILHHHERWDGTGYPDGLSKEDIPLLARVFAVADAFDAMTAADFYKPQMSPADAREEIRRNMGTQFDPAVAEAFLALDDDAIRDAARGEGGQAPLAKEPFGGPSSSGSPGGSDLLSRVGTLMTTADLNSTLQTILAELDALYGASTAAVLVLDEDATHLYFRAMRGYSPEVLEKVHPDLSAEVSIVARVAKTGRAYYAPDVTKDPLYLEGDPEMRSEACFPLLVDGKLFGVLNVESPKVDAFPGPIRTAMEAYAALAALAIHRVRREEELRLMAHTDPLTGLANRRAFWDALSLEVARAKRYGHPVSVLVVEGDHFKAVNDRYGHMTGDQVLQEIARTLASLSRRTDITARTGGDEFALMLPETDLREAEEVAQRIVNAIPESPLARDFGLTASLGVATLPDHGNSADTLFDAADQAMYQQKRLGGRGFRSAGD